MPLVSIFSNGPVAGISRSHWHQRDHYDIRILYALILLNLIFADLAILQAGLY